MWDEISLTDFFGPALLDRTAQSKGQAISSTEKLFLPQARVLSLQNNTT